MLPVLQTAEKSQNLPADKKCKQCGMPTFSQRCSFCRTINIFQQRFREANHRLNEEKDLII